MLERFLEFMQSVAASIIAAVIYDYIRNKR